jgi:hypothetical protein
VLDVLRVRERDRVRVHMHDVCAQERERERERGIIVNSKNQTVEYEAYFKNLEEELQQLQQMKYEVIKITNALFCLCKTTAGDGT